MDYLNRLTRLSDILFMLNNKNSLSVSELMEKYNLGKRTIQNDFKQYLLPLFKDEKIYYCHSSRKYKSKNNFLQKTLFSQEELALISMLQFKSKDKKEHLDIEEKTEAFFSKFEEIYNNNIYQKSSVEKIDDFQKEIIEIKNAIKRKNIIKCFYNNKYREIFPLKILNLETYWYLLVYEEKDKKIKTFHLNTIKEIQTLTTEFIYDLNDVNDFDNAITAYHKLNVEKITVQLLIKSNIAKYFIRKPLSPQQRIMREYKNNDIEIEIMITDFMEIIPTIQRYIPYIQVIEPESLRIKVNENLEMYIKENESPM